VNLAAFNGVFQVGDIGGIIPEMSKRLFDFISTALGVGALIILTVLFAWTLQNPNC
jgi:hypothetical protein